MISDAWTKSIFTAIIGLLSGMMLASYDADISDNRFFLEKQAKSADQVANEFSRYVVNWGRVITLKNHVTSEKRPPTAEENSRFTSSLLARNDAREKLFAAFDLLSLYFSPDSIAMVDAFRDWDQEQSMKTIEHLPNLDEWRRYERNILAELRLELIK